MKKTIYKILFIVLSAIFIYLYLGQEIYAYVINFDTESEKAEKQLSNGEIRIIVQQKVDGVETQRMQKDFSIDTKNITSAGTTINMECDKVLKKDAYTEIFFYWEQSNLVKEGHKYEIINSSSFTNQVNYGKSELDTGIGNRSYAGRLEFTGFNCKGSKTIPLKIYNSEALYPYTLTINLNVKIKESNYKAYLDYLKSQNIDANTYDVEASTRGGIKGGAAELADKKAKQLVKLWAYDGTSYENTEYGSFDYATQQDDFEYIRKQHTYEVKVSETETKVFCFEFALFEDEKKMVMYYKSADVTGSSEEEKKDIINKLKGTLQEAGEAAIEIVKEVLAEARGYKPFSENDDVLVNINGYIPTVTPVSNKITDKVNIVLTIITNIGMVMSIIMLAILGIKYMIGSVEEKSEYKQDLIPYLVGAVLLFGITTIVKILQQLGQSINNS